MDDSPVSSDKAEKEEVDEDSEDSSVSSDTTEKEDDKEKAQEGGNRSPDTTDSEDSSVRSDTAEKEDDKEKAQEGCKTPARTPAKKRGRNKKSADKNTTVKTPAQRHGKRKKATMSSVTFGVEESLPAKDCVEIYELLKAKYNGDEVLNVGGTIMTGAQLLKCIEDPKSALNLLGAFVECLKWDDNKNGYNKKRIIIQPQHQLDEEFVQVIKKEIGKAQGGKEIEQRFVPIVSYIIRNSLKLEADASTMLNMYAASEKFAELILILESNGDLETVKEKLNDEYLKIPIDMVKRVLAGLVLFEIKELWRMALLISTLSYQQVGSFSQEELHRSKDKYVRVERLITDLGLEGVWENMKKPLLNGHDIMRVLQIPEGPLVAKWIQRLVKWQLAHPQGTKEECEEWMKRSQQQQHPKRQKVEM